MDGFLMWNIASNNWINLNLNFLFLKILLIEQLFLKTTNWNCKYKVYISKKKVYLDVEMVNIK
jgi:hypothetical protein